MIMGHLIGMQIWVRTETETDQCYCSYSIIYIIKYIDILPGNFNALTNLLEC